MVYCAQQGWTDYTFENPIHPTRADIQAFVQTLISHSVKDFGLLTDQLADEARQQTYPWALEQLEHQAKQQDHILLLSMSPAFLVRAYARGLRLFDHASGTYFHTQQLVFSGRTKTLDKPNHLKRYLKVRDIGEAAIAFAAGDSMRNDGPILQQANHPVAVNPDRELRQHAIARGWEIVDANVLQQTHAVR